MLRAALCQGCGGSKDKRRGAKGEQLEEQLPEPFDPQYVEVPEGDVVIEEELPASSVACTLHRGTLKPLKKQGSRGVMVLIKEFQAEQDFNNLGLREATVLSNLSHPNVIQLHAISTELQYVITEHPAKHTVRQTVIGSGVDLSWSNAMKLCTGIANGLCFLHGLKRGELIHGNVNSGTVMITAEWDAKLADFENSQLVAPDGIAKADQVCLAFAAPEVLTKNKVLVKGSDVYSMAILFCAILNRAEPFVGKYGGSQDEIYKAIFQGERPSLPDWVPETLTKLINDCVVADVVERPSATKVKKLLGAKSVTLGRPASFMVTHSEATLEVEVKDDALC